MKKFCSNQSLKSVFICFFFLLNFLTVEIVGASPEVKQIYIDAPTALAASNVTSISFTARWNYVAGASSYKLTVYQVVGIANIILNQPIDGYDGKSVTSLSDKVEGLTPGDSYYYYVKALGSETSESSNVIEVKTLPTTPVSNEASSVTLNSFVASWSCSGATSYKLYVSVKDNSSGTWLALSDYQGKSVTSSSATITGLSANNIYKYWVVAVNSGGETEKSNEVTVTILPDPPVANEASSVTASSFAASWSSVTGATSYKLYVYRKMTSPLGLTLWYVLSDYDGVSLTGTSTSVTGLNANSSYKYMVSAVCSVGETDKSSGIIVTTVPEAPVADEASNVTTTTFDASWSEVSGATSYKFYAYGKVTVGEVESWITLTNYNGISVTDTVVTIAGLTGNKTYRYSVVAVSDAGTSEKSNSITVTTMPHVPVANDAASVTASSFRASWNVIDEATSYNLYVYTKETTLGISKWVVVSGYDGISVTDTTKLVANLFSNSDYKYYVTAVSSVGESDQSNSITLLTLPETPVSGEATGITSTSFTANWKGSKDDTSYKLFVLETSTGNFVDGYNGKSTTKTSVTVDNLSPKTEYQYYVTALIDANESEPSGIETVTTLSTVSVFEMEGQLLKLCPNPAKESVTITGISNGSIVKIYDIKGCLRKNEILTCKASINVSDLSKGIYLVTIEYNSTIQKRKLTIE